MAAILLLFIIKGLIDSDPSATLLHFFFPPRFLHHEIWDVNKRRGIQILAESEMKSGISCGGRAVLSNLSWDRE